MRAAPPPLERLIDLDRQLAAARGGATRLTEARAQAAADQRANDEAVAALAAALASHGLRRFDLGELDRQTPVSVLWGAERGRCIDRYYIEQFLERHAADIRGRVLEIHDDDYTRQYGGDRVTHSDVLDIDPLNARATVIADLRDPHQIPDGSYDCIILTQTLHVIYEMRTVLGQLRRLLTPGGVLLATLPCASRVAPEQGRDRDFWRFTAAAARRLFAEQFPAASVEVQSHGNVLVTIAYLYGLACHELHPEEFEVHDPYFPLIVSVRVAV